MRLIDKYMYMYRKRRKRKSHPLSEGRKYRERMKKRMEEMGADESGDGNSVTLLPFVFPEDDEIVSVKVDKSSDSDIHIDADSFIEEWQSSNLQRVDYNPYLNNLERYMIDVRLELLLLLVCTIIIAK